MTGPAPDAGVFTVSLDTELAWGRFDTAEGIAPYERAYRRTPAVVRRLCGLFETYGVPATWAVVAHLFEDCDGRHDDAPAVSLGGVDDWYGSLPCVTGIDEALWYAPEILDAITSCRVEQEVGLHGYSHLVFGAPGCERAHAERELVSGVETLRNHGVAPSSFVFPRNRIGHLDVLEEYGIEVYRGPDDVWFERMRLPRTLRKPFRYLNEAVKWTPPAVTPRRTGPGGLVEVSGSQAFRPLHGGWQYAPGSSRVERAIEGIENAAATGGIFHLRFHPSDLGFRPDELLAMLETVLAHADRRREEGDLELHPLSALASGV